MQDSIEDYIRIAKNITSSAETQQIKISKEVLVTAQRRKECEAYALKIVTFLLDGKLRPEVFLKCLKYINPEYYQDVVEERAITRLCGYPLCGKKIPEMPKQKYFVSIKVNKVYDIRERKNYCSNFCYKGSLHVKNQIKTSPLWLRNYNEINECELLPTSACGSPGKEIEQGVVKAVPELSHFTSITQFTQMSLEEVGEVEKVSKKSEKSNLKYKKVQKKEISLSVINEVDATLNETESEKRGLEIHDSSEDECNKCRNGNFNHKQTSSNEKNKTNRKCKETSIIDNSALNRKNHQEKKHTNEKEKLEHLITKLKIRNEPKTILIEPPPIKTPMKNKLIVQETLQESVSKLKTEPATEEISTYTVNNEASKVIFSNNSTSPSELLNKVKTYVEEWLTIDTFIYIYGENKVKEILNENKMNGYFDNLKITELEMTQQIKYMNICRRLHMRELAEEKFDNAVVEHSLKPLPDFKQLKEEVQELDLKVKSFYKGVLYEKHDTNFPTKIVKEDEENTVILPLVDVFAQNVLRRKVFLNSVNKILRKLIDELKLEENYVLFGIHDLVKSFKLQAHNIVFKPTTWPLIGVILLKMLALKERDIQHQLEKERSIEYIDLILSKYVDAKQIIQEIFILLDNVDKFVECYITLKNLNVM